MRIFFYIFLLILIHKICIFVVSSLSRMRNFLLLLLIKETLKLIDMNFTLFFVHLFPFSSCSYSSISMYVQDFQEKNSTIQRLNLSITEPLLGKIIPLLV